MVKSVGASSSSSSGSSSSGVADWARPYVQGTFESLLNEAASGNLHQVAGFSPEQEAALRGSWQAAEAQKGVAQQSQTGVDTLQALAAGEGDAFNRLRDARVNDANLAEGQALAAAGPLAGGGSRAARAAAFGRAQLGHGLAKEQGAAAQALGGAAQQTAQLASAPLQTLFAAGDIRQAQQQKYLDRNLRTYDTLFRGIQASPLTESSSQQQSKSNSFSLGFNDGTMGVPGPMAMEHIGGPDTFINGEIASEHYPKFMGGTPMVPGYNDGMTGGESFQNMTAKGGESYSTAPAPAPSGGGGGGLADVAKLAVGANDGATDIGQMPPPMGGMMDFGYQPSGPTRQELHADMQAAGKENREMTKMKNDERRKEEMHQLKMAEAKQMGAVKVANAKKGPMARGPEDK